MESPYATSYCPSYLTSSWVGPTLPSLTEVSFLLLFPFVSDSTWILLSVSFIRIFIEIYNCFTECFTVEFTIAPNTPIYNQYQAVFFTRRAIILAKNRPGDEASMNIAPVGTRPARLVPMPLLSFPWQ